MPSDLAIDEHIGLTERLADFDPLGDAVQSAREIWALIEREGAPTDSFFAVYTA